MDGLLRSAMILGQFADALLHNTAVQPYDTVTHELTVCAQVLVAAAAESSTLSAPQRRVCSDAAHMLRTAVDSDASPLRATAHTLGACITATQDRLKRLQVGDAPVLIPTGWRSEDDHLHLLFLCVQVAAEDTTTANLVVCNGGTGLQYHEASHDTYPNTKYRSWLHLPRVPRVRLQDSGVLYWLFHGLLAPSAQHSPRMFYDVLFPTLVQGTLIEVDEVPHGCPAYFSAPQAAPHGWYKSVSALVRYLCSAAGLPYVDMKHVLLGIRCQWLSLALQHCHASPQPLNESQSTCLSAAMHQLARHAVRLAPVSPLRQRIAAVLESAEPLLRQQHAPAPMSAACALRGPPCAAWNGFPGFDFLQDTRPTDGFSGPPQSHPAADPVPSLPASPVTTADDLLRLLQSTCSTCDQLRSRMAIATPSLVSHRIAVLVEHVVLSLIPVPTVHTLPWLGLTTNQATVSEQLFQLATHYVAALKSIPYDRLRAGTAAATMACLVVAMDAVLSSLPAYAQSCLSCVSFARQPFEEVTDQLLWTDPHALLARAACIEYMRARRAAVQVHLFEFHPAFKFSSDDATLRFIQTLAAGAGLDVTALPDVIPTLDAPVKVIGQPSDVERALCWLCHHWAASGVPEFAHARDVVLLYKLMLEWDPAQLLIPRQQWHTLHACPAWRPPEILNGYPHCAARVGLFGKDYLAEAAAPQVSAMTSPAQLLGRFAPRRGLVSEADVVVVPTLHDWGNTLSQADAEELACLLTVPYLRIPLLLRFLAADRVGLLSHDRMQTILERVLFEPWTYGTPPDLSDALIPFDEHEQRTHLATPWGLLVNELMLAPTTLLDPLLALGQAVVDTSTRDHSSSYLNTVLFTMQLFTRVATVAAALVRQPAVFGVSARAAPPVQHCHAHLVHFLHGPAAQLLAATLADAVAHGNHAISVRLQAQLALFSALAMEAPAFLKSCARVIHWHEFALQPPPGPADQDGARIAVPLAGVLRALQQMQPVIQGAFQRATPAEAHTLLSDTLAGLVRTSGAWTQHAPTVWLDTARQLCFDTSSCELLVDGHGFMRVPEEVTRHPDFAAVLPDAHAPCALILHTQHQRTYRIFHNGHRVDVVAWRPLRGPVVRLPSATQQHEYEASTCHGLPQVTAEHATLGGLVYSPWTPAADTVQWLSDDLARVAAQYDPCSVWIHKDQSALLWVSPTAAEAGEQPAGVGVWFLIRICGATRSLHAFQLVHAGRRLLPQAVWSTGNRASLHDWSGDSRRFVPAPAGAAAAFGFSPVGSLVIRRDDRVFIPNRHLYGLLPQALVEQYQFWQVSDAQLHATAASPSASGTTLSIDMLAGRAFVRRRTLSSGDTFLLHNLQDEALHAWRAWCATFDGSSHALLWSTTQGLPHECCEISRVEFPRLGLHLMLDRVVDGQPVFQVAQHDGLRVSLEAPDAATAVLCVGLPHAMIMHTRDHDTCVLVPSVPVTVACAPDAPFTATVRASGQSTASRHNFVYKVHASGQFLMCPSTAASLYLLMCKLLARQYGAVAQVLPSCHTEGPLLNEEAWCMTLCKQSAQDVHPNAAACRLQLMVLCLNAQSPLLNPATPDDLRRYVHHPHLIRSDLRLQTADLQRIAAQFRDAWLIPCFDALPAHATSPVSSVRVPCVPARLNGGLQLAAVLRQAATLVATIPPSRLQVTLQYKAPPAPDCFGPAAVHLIRRALSDSFNGDHHQLGALFWYELTVGSLPLQFDASNVSWTCRVCGGASANADAHCANCGAARDSWQCQACGRGCAASSVVCEHCAVPKPGTVWRCAICESTMRLTAPDCTACGNPKGSWPCSTCTFANPEAVTRCQICDYWRPRGPADSTIAPAQSEDSAPAAAATPNLLGALAVLHKYVSAPAQVDLSKPFQWATWAVLLASTAPRHCPQVETELRAGRPHVLGESRFGQQLIAALRHLVEQPAFGALLLHFGHPVHPQVSLDLPFPVALAPDFTAGGRNAPGSAPFTIDMSVPRVIQASAECELTVSPQQADALLHTLVSDMPHVRDALVWLPVPPPTLNDAMWASVRENPSAAATRFISKLHADWLWYRDESASKRTPALRCLSHVLFDALRAGDESAAPQIAESWQSLQLLRGHLKQEAERGAAIVDTVLASARSAATPADTGSVERWAAPAVVCNTAQIVAGLLNGSSHQTVATVLSLAVTCLSHIRRCIAATSALIFELEGLALALLLQRMHKAQADPQCFCGPALKRALEASGHDAHLAAQLYIHECVPRLELLHSAVGDWVAVGLLVASANGDLLAAQHKLAAFPDVAALHAAVLQHRRGVYVDGVRLDAALHPLPAAAVMGSMSSRLHTLQLAAQSTAAMLCARRAYVDGCSLNPRFLVFEFMTNVLLRPRQVELVQQFVAAAAAGQSNVSQMIMGAGKTSVIAPLLAMMLAGHGSLVLNVVPAPLLAQTVAIMRATFSSVVIKRVMRLEFDRTAAHTSDAAWLQRLHTTLQRARDEDWVICTTPEAVKSLLLKYLDLLSTVETCPPVITAPFQRWPVAKQRQLQSVAVRYRAADAAADALRDILQLWSRHAVALLDEVDQILHPLRSELNFPIGGWKPLPLSPQRWMLPLVLIDAALSGSNAALHAVIMAGIRAHAFQATPHLVLLLPEYYHQHVKPLLAQVLIHWFHHHGCQAPWLGDWLLLGTPPGQPEVLRVEQMQLLTLARDWLHSFMPHCMSKIHRVAYGLLEASGSNDRRHLLAVPFLGKPQD